MTKRTQQRGSGTSRRRFLGTGLAVGAGAVGASLLTRQAQAALAVAGQGSLTTGGAAILRFLAAAEIIETDLWRQYNELGVSRIARCRGAAGARRILRR